VPQEAIGGKSETNWPKGGLNTDEKGEEQLKKEQFQVWGQSGRFMKGILRAKVEGKKVGISPIALNEGVVCLWEGFPGCPHKVELGRSFFPKNNRMEGGDHYKVTAGRGGKRD